LEIERKFLVVGEDYKQLAISRYAITQGYLCKEPDRTVRVRIKTSQNGQGKAFLTIKSKPNNMGFSRFEWEKEIDVADAKQLIQLCLPGVIEKTRWLIPCAHDTQDLTSNILTWEIDEFHGRLEGRVIAELELQHEHQTFIKPDFIGQEVTGMPQYYNANM
jgi:CYTH domain-containing protein